MASIVLTRGNTLPDSSAKSDFHNLVDLASASITNIENADISNSAAIAASKLNLATVAQDIAMSSKVINFAKGSDIASATTTDIGASTGNFIDITGTTTITGLGTVQAGAVRFVRFTGALILTHNATSLILPTAANITTVANDRAIFVSLGSGNWICLAYQRADGTSLVGGYTPTAANALSGSVIQSLYTTDSTVVTCSGNIPIDNTKPQSGEGTEYTQLAKTITPNNASNTLVIKAKINGQHSAGSSVAVALFQDSGADALCTAIISSGAAYDVQQGYLVYKMAAGTTSPTTFKIRIGAASGTFYTNANSIGTSYFNGTYLSSIEVLEIKA